MELPKERLATTDEHGSRVYLYPAAVRGYFRKRRILVQTFLMLLFILLPWIHIQGNQLVFLDIARREFFLFGLHFRAHDTPLILLILLSFTFLIGFITAIWGRLWCGWACPQTVFTELVFRKIESWVEGSHRERKALDSAKWDKIKITKKFTKYLLFLFVSLIITHSFLAYFVGSYNLIHMITGNPIENWTSFLVIIFTTAVILFDFGWFREQFCVIMCPYGRFQSVMLDSQSLVVAYETKRGEPRRETNIKDHGDCVNCYRCVQVCPTGIDIRRGLQMECIACTACIDACDEVMTKIKKPTGLIRYSTQAELDGKKRKYLQPRSVIYAALFLASFGGLMAIITKKDFLDIDLLRAKGAPYELLMEKNKEIVMNHFYLEVSNQVNSDIELDVKLMEEYPNIEFVMPMSKINLPDGANQRVDFFVKFPREILKDGGKKIHLKLDIPKHEREIEVPLVGPNS